jgi:hypothetical protein
MTYCSFIVIIENSRETTRKNVIKQLKEKKNIETFRIVDGILLQ